MGFEVGAIVRARAQRYEGHTRLPGYLQRCSGVIERVLGEFPLADDRAAGRPDAPKRCLYTVRFAANEVWSDAPRGDTLRADLFEDYLEAVE
jgi:nitrile hydratase subunit beta